MVRIDHFRAISSYWVVPRGELTARGGHWAPGPGPALLQALHMVTRLRPRRCAPWVHPLVRVLFGLCLAILVASVVLPASGVILPRLYGGRAATAALFFLLGALLWLTQPDTGQ